MLAFSDSGLIWGLGDNFEFSTDLTQRNVFITVGCFSHLLQSPFSPI